VTGQAPTFDDSTAGKTLREIYTPCVQAVAKEFGWDFARRVITLTASGNAAPFPFGLAHEYLYPGNGVEIWQLIPQAADFDPDNPLPYRPVIGNTLVSSVQTKVIWTNLANAVAAYNNVPTEATWDAGFRAACVRRLASELADAIAGRPDTAQQMLSTGATLEGVYTSRNG
jgi:hypothetical protein